MFDRIRDFLGTRAGIALGVVVALCLAGATAFALRGDEDPADEAIPPTTTTTTTAPPAPPATGVLLGASTSPEIRSLAAEKSVVEQLEQQIGRTLDIDARKLLYRQFQVLFLKDLPSIPLYVPLFTYFVSDKVTGVDPGVLFSPASRFRNVYEWTVTTPAAIGNN